jgi:inorganic phosphate transporter, PiT family
MEIFIIVLGAALILIIGRNDGTPLIAIAMRGLPVSHWWIVFSVVALLPLAPLLGIYLVAESLYEVFPGGPGNDTIVVGILLATILTIIASIFLRAPNSITLALVGGATGASLGAGVVPNWSHISFVLIIAGVAPILGCLVASTVPYRIVQPVNPGMNKIISMGKMRWPALIAIIMSYSLNDGQKLIFIIAISLTIPISDIAGSLTANGVALALFLIGMLSGVRSSMSLLAHGVLRTTPLSAVWAQVSTSITLVGGSLIGAPMSMTQTLQGSLLGSGLKRGTKVIRWRSVVRIVMAWVWTLPVSGVLSFSCVALMNKVVI